MNDPIALWGFSTSSLELISFVLSVVTVWLNIRQIHWAWLFAILSSALYGLVFFDARLYGDMGLQVVFIAVSIWGWLQWLRWLPEAGVAAGTVTGGDEKSSLSVSRLNARGVLWSAMAWLLCFVVLAVFLQKFTDTDVPYADGFLTAGSLLGQLLLSRKKIENWHVWIIVDVLYVALYMYKNLMLTALLYALFVVMAIIGLRAWKKVGAA